MLRQFLNQRKDVWQSWETCRLSGEVRADGGRSQPGFSGVSGVCALCLVSGKRAARQRDGRRSLRRECSESANKCVRGSQGSQTD